MNQFCLLIAGLLTVTSLSTPAASCVDPRDRYDDYDNRVSARQIKNIPSEYYVLSYSWSPGYCAGVDADSKQPGKRNFLQCGSGRGFGYILHGLWPQGSMDRPGVFPRACEGDQPKVPRKILEKYLCMTPSLNLLQHEWEFHGTCLHDESLETPDTYFSMALELHSRMRLPERELPNTQHSRDWFYTHNPHLASNAIKYLPSSREWLFCFSNEFRSMTCPGRTYSATP